MSTLIKKKTSKKIVVIINGKGGVGKDTLCEIADKYYYTKVVSAITPIKDIASKYGWTGSKDNRSRKFLSDLKRCFIDYNNLPNEYLENEYLNFIKSSDDVLFVHIRENDQIDDFKNRIKIKCVTLLVDSSRISDSYGNDSDDQVDDYEYDYYYNNEKNLEEIELDFMNFFKKLLKKEGVLFNE